MDTVRIATRRSELAVAQANFVGSLMGLPFELVFVTTQGDRDQSSSLSVIGGQGVFTKEVQNAVLRGAADIAVHSAKDLPSRSHDELTIGAVPKREDTRDVLVGSLLSSLPEGGTVFTSSNRRKAQLLSLRPDLKILPARGNIATRMRLASEGNAVLVAKAALNRLKLRDYVGETLPIDSFTPQVGQGALAIESHRSNGKILSILSTIGDPETFGALICERSFLDRLGAGCTMPVGAICKVSGGNFHVDGFVGLEDGTRLWRASCTGEDPIVCGRDLAEKLIEMSGKDFELRERS